MTLAPETLERLKQASTATLTTQLFKRGLRNVCVQNVRRLSHAGTNLVGEAFTLRYIPAREDLDQVSVFDDPEHPQRKAIETVPPGQVLVMDCRGETRAASAGNILVTRLRVRGAAGVVTDGCPRDSMEIAGGGVAVYPGDVMVGDGEGVVVLPRHLADEVARDAAEQELLEIFLLQEIEQGRSLPGTYPPNAETLARYREWRARSDAAPK